MNSTATHTVQGNLIVKLAETRNGWKIGIIERRDYRTDELVSYGIIRVNPQGKYVTLYNCFTLEDARKAANEEWVAERRATEPKN